MAVIRGPRPERDFYPVPNRLARDSALSFEARGLLICLLTNKEGWSIQPKQLAENGGCGVQRVYRILRELAEAGYATCEAARDGNGTFTKHDWIVTDNPPLTQNALVDDALVDNHPIRKTIDKEQQSKKNDDSTPFDDFWKAYPNKQGKQSAKNRWKRLTEEERQSAMDDVKQRITGDPQWASGYIPHGSTYINQKRWEDEWRNSPRATSVKPADRPRYELPEL